MCRFCKCAALHVTVLVLFVCFATSVVHAGPFDKLLKKVEKKTDEETKKVDENTDKAADDAVDKAAEDVEDAVTGKGKEGAEGSGAATATKSGSSSGSGGKVSSVSTKFDYVPGDSVMFFDDLTQDELGEFPARWRLKRGTFEVAEMEGERWLRCVSVDGYVRMKVPNLVILPEFWTLEFDFYGTEPMGSGLAVRALGDAESQVWEATFPVGNAMTFRTGEIFSTTPYEGASIGGRHHVMIMARGTAVKAYMDRQRMASVPEIAVASGKPALLEFRLWAATHPMIANVRLAEGCRPPKDMLAEGKLVTYGIRFASGSDVVEAESAPVLRQIAFYLDANSEVKLQIVGHTDNVGAAAANLDLSKRRAASVARVLASEFKIAADRFKTDGKGDTKPVSSNAKPEGRAMNRRVEFIKL